MSDLKAMRGEAAGRLAFVPMRVLPETMLALLDCAEALDEVLVALHDDDYRYARDALIKLRAAP